MSSRHRGGRPSTHGFANIGQEIGARTGIRDVEYPRTSQKAFARAFNLTVDEAGTDRLIDFIKDAFLARPEFVDIRLSSRQTSNSGAVKRQTINLLKQTRAATAQTLAADDISRADYLKKSSLQINARMIVYLRDKLEENLQTRGEQQIGENQIHNPLPVAMANFRKSPEYLNSRLYEMLWSFLEFMGKQLTSRNPFRVGSTLGDEVRAKVRQLRVKYAPNPAAQQQLHQQNRNVVVTLDKTGASRELALPTAPRVTLAQFQNLIRTRFAFHQDQDTLNEVFLYRDDSSTAPLATDADMNILYDQALDPVNVIAHHTHLPPADGNDDTTLDTYYPEQGTNIGQFPAWEGRRSVDPDRRRRLIDFVKELAKDDEIGEGNIPELEQEVQREADDMLSDEPTHRAARAEAEETEDISGMTPITQEVFDYYRNGAPHPRYGHMGTVHTELRRLLQGCTLVDDWRIPSGRELTDGQKCGLLWHLEKEIAQGGAINADAPGMGKTTLAVAVIIASNYYWQAQGTPVAAPTIFVVPAMLVEKTVDELSTLFDQDFPVWRFGRHPQKPDLIEDVHHVKIEEGNVAFMPFHVGGGNHSDPGNHIIVVGAERLAKECDDADLSQLPEIGRIIVDECHLIRYFEQTKRGQYIKALNAPRRHGFSATPLYDSLIDLGGYVAFLQQPHFGEKTDKNELPDAPRHLQYIAAKQHFLAMKNRLLAGNQLPDVQQVRGVAAVPQNDGDFRPWPRQYFDMAHATLPNRRSLLGSCEDWPAAGLFWNTHLASGAMRPLDVDDPRRSATTPLPPKLKKFAPANPPTANPEPPPFNVNPYHAYHEKNGNKLQCLTVEAWNYYVKPLLHDASRKGNQKSRALAIQFSAIIYNEICLSRDHTSIYVNADGQRVKFSPNLPPLAVERRRIQFTPREWNFHRAYSRDIDQDVDFDLSNTVDGRTNEDVQPEQAFVHTSLGEGGDGDVEAAPKPELGPAKHPQRIRLCTHPAFRMWRFRRAGDWERMRGASLAYMLWEIRKARVCALDRTPNPFDDETKVLEQALFGSPKYRQMLIDVHEAVTEDRTDGKNNVIVYTDFGSEAILADKYLAFVGFKTICLTSAMAPDARYRLMRDGFNEHSDEPTVLIVPLTLKLLGMNLHVRCRRVLCLGQSHNHSTLLQAFHRVHRLDQEADQLVTRYHIPYTYMSVQEKRINDKATNTMAVTAAAARKWALKPGAGPQRDNMLARAKLIARTETGAVPVAPDA